MSASLGERALACKGWRWMPGMLAHHRHVQSIRVLCDESGECASDYVVRAGADGNEVQLMHEWGVMGSFPGGDGSAYPMVPDLDDPATRGCLLDLVREAWAMPKLYVSPHGLSWRMKIKGHGGPFKEVEWGGTEAEALVAALEAAPTERLEGGQ
jgi:hypothetical protein